MENVKISVIIPSYFEKEERLLRSISTLNHEKIVEIIIVESGIRYFSHSFFESNPKIKHLKSNKRSRAYQMNEGAKAASGDYLLFMHADTCLGAGCIDEALKLMKDDDVSLVSFSLKFDSKKRCLRIIEFGVRLRNALFCLPYGDQCYFVWKVDFNQAKCFDSVPILEDVKLVEKMKKLGYVVITEAYVTTSARRYEEKGTFRTYLRNLFIMTLYHLGVPLDKLKRFY